MEFESGSNKPARKNKSSKVHVHYLLGRLFINRLPNNHVFRINYGRRKYLNISSDDKPPSSPSPKDDEIKKTKKREKENKRGSPNGKENGVKPGHEGLRRRPTPKEEEPTPVPSKKLPIPERITENMQIKPMQDEVSIMKADPSTLELVVFFEHISENII